jgi:uncharacterized protein (TIGR03083 family)
MPSDYASSDLDYLAHLALESSRFGAALRQVSPEASVPTCPAWTADDLLWHLAEVQWFWGTVVREQVSGPEATKLKPSRPASGAALWDFYTRASHDLGQALASASPDAPAWTWSSDQTVGFIRRRQAHEALIHRVDAELTAGDRTPMDARLSADGIDEALRVMYGGLPPWASLSGGSARSIRISTNDTRHSWLVSPGRLTGTDPEDGRSYEEPCLEVKDENSGVEVGATVAGNAADLDCWLWHRPTIEATELAGDGALLGPLESMIAGGIN